MWTDVSEEHITSIVYLTNCCTLAFLLGWFSTLKTKVICFSETSVDIQTTRCYMPEDGNSQKYLPIIWTQSHRLIGSSNYDCLFRNINFCMESRNVGCLLPDRKLRVKYDLERILDLSRSRKSRIRLWGSVVLTTQHPSSRKSWH
jgi:hypothetical protein